MTYAALFFGTLLGCLIGRQYGFMEARRLADTLKRWNAAQDAPEDVELAYFGDRWTSRN